MFKLIAILILLLRYRGLQCSLYENDIIKCNIEDENFWKIYRWHFGNATSITISLLQSSYPNNVKELLSELFRHLYLHTVLTKTFYLANQILEKEYDEKDLYLKIRYEDCQCTNHTYIQEKYGNFNLYQDFVHFQRMRRYSNDPEDAFLIITWNEYDLERFLVHPHRLFPKPRGTYMIIFASPTDFDEQKLVDLFRKIWEQIGVLNLLVKRLCSRNKLTYMFDPFVNNKNEWGELKKFDLELLQKADYHNILRNFRGYPLHVSIFARMPTAVKPLPKGVKENKVYDILYKSGGFGGLDGTVLATLADYLNFVPVIHIPPPDVEYGFQLPNGTFVGSLGDVIYRNVAISFNARFLAYYGTNRIEYTTPVNHDMLCLIVPSAESIPHWLTIFRCFTLEAWLGLFGMYILATIYWCCLKPINLGTNLKNKKNVVSAFEIYSIFLSASTKMPSLDSHRVFFASCMLYCIIVTGTFQSSLVTSFTTITYYPNIKTLQELADSKLKIGTASMGFAEIFEDATPVSSKLRSKIVLLNGTNSMAQAAYVRDMAAFERSADAKMRIKTEFTMSDGFELLHVVKECPRSVHVTYIMSKGSPYLPVFDHVITVFREAGLLAKWSTDTVEAFILERRKVFTGSSKTKVFTLRDVQTAFYLLSLGLIFSTIVFLVEVCGCCCIKCNYKR